MGWSNKVKKSMAASGIGAELPDLVHNGVLDWAVGLCGHLGSLILQTQS